MNLRRILALFIFAFALPAQVQQYPSRPVRVLVGYAAGSSTDIVGRVMADRLGAYWKQTVIVENRGGAAEPPLQRRKGSGAARARRGDPAHPDRGPGLSGKERAGADRARQSRA